MFLSYLLLFPCFRLYTYQHDELQYFLSELNMLKINQIQHNGIILTFDMIQWYLSKNIYTPDEMVSVKVKNRKVELIQIT